MDSSGRSLFRGGGREANLDVAVLFLSLQCINKMILNTTPPSSPSLLLCLLLVASSPLYFPASQSAHSFFSCFSHFLLLPKAPPFPSYPRLFVTLSSSNLLFLHSLFFSLLLLSLLSFSPLSFFKDSEWYPLQHLYWRPSTKPKLKIRPLKCDLWPPFPHRFSSSALLLEREPLWVNFTLNLCKVFSN